ncbi:MAG: Oxygen-independent coproporphyrinogen III oxidase [Phycisphaerae bacterium]|nr:Oxygen-independent coproporphyrinogen III oxidase [Phycisphaerae bacterium]
MVTEATHDTTELGNYFIANYPPFSAWSPQHVADARAALDRPPRPGTPLGLYLHIPFCRKRCTFCYFRVYTDKNAADVETYLKAIGREVELYAGRAGIGGRHFEFVYFGGGTPSFLSNEQLLRLVDRIGQHWSWDRAREVTFECEPGTLKQSKLETIKRIGVTRLSLGVEHFDDEVLAANGRAHRSAEIFRAYQWAREARFDQINIDLIAGMVGENDDRWRRTVAKAIELAPDSVTIYQLELPYNTEISRASKLSGDAPPVADWPTKRNWVDYAFGQFESVGYAISSAYTLVRPGPHAGFVYRDSNWHGADMIGAGVASFSHFQGVHYQNLDRWENYVQSLLDDGRLPIARALPISDEQRMIRELILQLKLGRLEDSYFQDKFGVNIRERFAEPFESLADEGLADLDGPGIRLTRGGLLRADGLLPRFFEPRYRNIRYT